MIMENIKKKFHMGTLKKAFYNPHYEWVEGHIYGHPGFNEGNYIHTSQIVKMEGNEIETLNSKYTVEWLD